MTFTLGRKLGLGFGILTALLLVLGAVSWYNASQGDKGVTEVSEMMKDTAVGGQMTQAMLMVRMNVKDFLITNSDHDLKQYEEWKAEFQKHLTTCEANFQNPKRRELIAEIRQDYEQYDATFSEVQEVIFERNRILTEVLSVVGKEVADGLKAEVYAANDRETSDKQLTHQLASTLFDVFEGRLYVMKYLSSSSKEAYERARSELEHAQTKIDELVTTLPDHDPLKATLIDLSNKINIYRENFAVFNDRLSQRNDLVHNTLDVLGPEIAAAGKEIQTSLEEDGQATEKAVHAAMSLAFIEIIAVLIASIVIAIIAGTWITRLVTKPISVLLQKFQYIADGDLTQRIEVKSNDEIGDLSHGFNALVTDLQKVMVEVNSTSNDVAAASTQIAAASEEMAQGMSEQQAQTSQAAAAVEEMSSSVVEVANKSADAASNANQAGEQASEGGEVVQKSVDGINAIALVVNESANAINALGERSEQIGQVVDVINDIADQTNLLALNAAIEAARAGEHGRGFAVVADEVRKLADRTTKATEEIADSITAIQKETRSAVERMEAGQSQVEEGVGYASKAGESLAGIVSSSRSVADMIQSIAAAAEEQSATASEISRTVESISAVSQQSAAGASQSSQAAQQLSAKSENLRTLVSRFKLD